MKKIFKDKTKVAVLIVVLGMILVALAWVGLRRFVWTKEKILQTQIPQELVEHMDALLASIEQKSAMEFLNVKINRPPERFTGVFLNGILWSGKTHFALVNNAVVEAGDEIEGYVVIAIDGESVTLRDKDGNEKNIYLYGKQ